MKIINYAPTTQSETAGVRFLVCYKGTKYMLSKLQGALFTLLSNGGRYSSLQLMIRLHTSDPRKEVHRFRSRGINVHDEWVEATSTISRHKRYWINPNDVEEVRNE